MITRTNVAQYAADQLASGADRQTLIKRLAAWLKQNHHTRQSHFLINDISKKLLDYKYLFITVTSARPISQNTRNIIDNFLKNQFGSDYTIEHKEIIDPKVIGGVIIDTPKGSLDTSVRHKLDTLLKGAQL